MTEEYPVRNNRKKLMGRPCQLVYARLRREVLGRRDTVPFLSRRTHEVRGMSDTYLSLLIYRLLATIC